MKKLVAVTLSLLCLAVTRCSSTGGPNSGAAGFWLSMAELTGSERAYRMWQREAIRYDERVRAHQGADTSSAEVANLLEQAAVSDRYGRHEEAKELRRKAREVSRGKASR